ncbi:MAG: hypothetical protein HKN23_10710 [Verrucomicrobiales bacterium]|nr:hypothetical protein [Verrucomicrobiales bacterium]
MTRFFPGVATFLATLPFLPAQDGTDWKLQPLKYNNPGLVVDLGVGLWAWPMPMDYDGDGDFDLLVACPDKPSNGVYFFENTSDDPKVKMPVFKAGVHIGKTTHNFQVSYVDGEPRILKPGFEFPRGEDGKFNFDKPKKIYPTTRIHDKNTRGNMWRYVDYDGDGDHDLIVGAGDWTDYVWDHAYDSHGRWRNGPLHGYVYFVENEGSDAEPKYSNKRTKIEAGGGVIDVYGWPCPNFADFDGDGDLDLICGEFLDGFTYFENIGTRTEPEYAAGEKLNATDGEPLVMDLQMITPTVFDWDGDGDFDLIVGDEDGRVALVENLGGRKNAGAPEFAQPVYFQEEADTLKFGALATPFAYDWDADGDEDILCGNTAGYIGLFENLGDGKWDKVRLLGAEGKEPFRILAGPSGSIQGPCEAKWGYTTLSVADWDADGNPDLLVNGIWGELHRLEKSSGQSVNSPDKRLEAEVNQRRGRLMASSLTLEPQTNPEWFWWNKTNSEPTTQWRTTPVATDWNGDDSMDIVGLDRDGFLSLREQLGDGPERIFLDEDYRPIQLARQSAGRSGRHKLAVVDWDGDGRLDILTNSENATFWRNCKDGDKPGTVILKKIGNLAKRNVSGHTSSPAACDFDKNGKPDLLVGSENGRIYFIKHEDTTQFTAEQIEARPPKKIPPTRFPGLVKEEFVFTKAKFPQCHASTICETSRGLVCAWFGGTKEKHDDVGIWVSYHDGGGWSAPKEWANGVQHAGLRYPTWNPVLFQPPGDAPTMLFFKCGPNPREWWGEVMVSYDRGRSFRDRRRLPATLDGPVRCKPILIDGGNTLLSGSSTEYDGWTVHFEKATLADGEITADTKWKRIGPINQKDEFNAIQPTFLQHKDGRLQVLCRTQESVISTSFSDDNGETWSKMEAIDLPNPNAGVDVVTLKDDGRFLMIYNHLGSGKTGWGRRGMLNLAISEDGLTWKKVVALEKEEKAEFSYPAIIQSDDGLVHLTYTWKRQRIKHVVVDPAELPVGEVLTKGNWPE